MSARSTIDFVSDEYGQEWNTDTMLMLALEYIDNQQSDDGWEDFLLEAVVTDDEFGLEEDESEDTDA